MKLCGWVGLGASLAILASCAARPTYTLRYAEKRAVLENGLRVVVLPDKTTPMVHVAVRYEVGSKDDPPGKAGLAHLVEHMMFDHRLLGPDGPTTFDLLPQIATTYNAYTTFDKTHYHTEARAEEVDALLRLEAARLGKGCESLSEAEFQREREVVRNEIRQRGATPEQWMPAAVSREAYPTGHAYHETVGGDDAQLSNIRFEDVCAFFKNHYVPERATVVVVGPVAPEEIGKKAQSYFSGIPRGQPAPQKVVAAPPPFQHRIIKKKLDADRSYAWIVWRGDPVYSDRGPMSEASAFALGGYLEAFNYDWKFATAIEVASIGGYDAPLVVAVLELRKPGDLDSALEYVWKATKQAHRAFEQGTTSEDKEFKARFKARRIMALESLSNRADEVSELIQFRKDFDFKSKREVLLDELDRIDAIDRDRYRDHIKTSLSKERAMVVFFESDKHGATGDTRSKLTFSARTHGGGSRSVVTDPAEARRALPVPQMSSLLGKAERYTLANGMRVVLLPYDTLPVVRVAVTFDSGSVHEGPENAGLAEVAAGLLLGPPNADFGRAGVTFSGDAGLDQTHFYSASIALYLEVAIRGLERIIRAGGHDQKLLEYWQRRQKDALENTMLQRQQRFSMEFGRALYGPEHPYARAGQLTIASVGRLNYDKVSAFTREHYTAENGTVVVVGNFDPAQARKLIANSFGDWERGSRDLPVPRVAWQDVRAAAIAAIEPRTPQQIAVTIAYPTPAGIDGQYAARRVLAAMLDLQMRKIRTELGATYGISAGVDNRPSAGLYALRGALDATRGGEALVAIREKLGELRAGTDFDRLFVEARRSVFNQFLSEYSETGSVLARLLRLAAFRLPADFYEQQIRMVASVSPAQIKELIRAELDPKREIVGAIGTRGALEEAFRQARISAVRYLEDK